VKTFLKSVNSLQIYGQKLVAYFLATL